MDQIKSLDRKHLIGILILLLLLVAIPLTMYLIRQQQILKSRADEVTDRMAQFSGPNVTQGNPPAARSRNVQITINYPVPSPPRYATTLTAPASITGTAGTTVTWSALTPDSDSIYYIGHPGYNMGAYPHFDPRGIKIISGGSCYSAGAVELSNAQRPASSGSCIFEGTLPAGTGLFTMGKFKLKEATIPESRRNQTESYVFANVASSNFVIIN